VAGIFAGIAGTIHTTMLTTADVLSFGNVLSDGNPLQAVKTFVHNAIIPKNANFGGVLWGKAQGRDPDSILHQGDLANFHHDDNRNEIEWIKRNYTTKPQTTPHGPVGAAYALLGTIPFGLKGLIDGESYP
jgi:hypothetical protein